MPKKIEKHELFGGRASVFLRDDSPNYYSCVYLPKTRKYKTRSTGTTVLQLAVKDAESFYHEIMGKIANGIPVLEMKVRKLVDLWRSQIVIDLKRELVSKATSDKQLFNLNGYIEPYFGDRAVTSITGRESELYFDWRVQNHRAGSGVPAKSTAARRSGWKLSGDQDENGRRCSSVGRA